jgi:hypothetical protein
MIAGVEDPKKAVDLLIAEANKRWMATEQVSARLVCAAHHGLAGGLHSTPSPPPPLPSPPTREQVVDDTTIIIAHLDVPA